MRYMALQYLSVIGFITKNFKIHLPASDKLVWRTCLESFQAKKSMEDSYPYFQERTYIRRCQDQHTLWRHRPFLWELDISIGHGPGRIPLVGSESWWMELLCGSQPAASELGAASSSEWSEGGCISLTRCLHCCSQLGKFPLIPSAHPTCSIFSVFQYSCGPVLSDGSLQWSKLKRDLFISSDLLTWIISLVWFSVLLGRGAVSSCLQGHSIELRCILGCYCIKWKQKYRYLDKYIRLWVTRCERDGASAWH